MWILYTIKKGLGPVQYSVLSRLRPNQKYQIFGKTTDDPQFSAFIEVGSFSEENVTKPHCKPELILRQKRTDKSEVIVDDKSASDGCHLLDNSILRQSSTDSRLKIVWERMTIYKEGEADQDYYDLVTEGSKLAFHVVRDYRSVSHMYVTESTQSQVSIALVGGLMRNKYVVTKSWIYDIFLKAEDKKFSMKLLNDAVNPVVWEDFGPLKRPALLSVEPRRKTLFEDMEFIVFSRDQYNSLQDLVKPGKGQLIYYNINDTNIEINDKTIFISPPDNIRSIEAYSEIKNQFFEKTGSLREIEEVEISYSILYCSTNHTCNPCASLGSLDLQLSADDAKQLTNRSLAATVQYNPDADYSDDDAKQLTNRSLAATVPYDPDADSSDDDEEGRYVKDMEKFNRGSCSLAATNYDDQGVSVAEPEQMDSAPQEQHRAIEPAANTVDQEAANEVEQRDEHTVIQQDVERTIDQSEEDLPSLMGSLNDFFEDFVGTMKPLPPPKSKSSTSSTAPTARAVTSPAPSTPAPPVATPVAIQVATPAPSALLDFSAPPASSSSTTTTGRRRLIQPTDSSRAEKKRKIEFDDYDETVSPTTAQSTAPPPYREEQGGNFMKIVYAPLIHNPRPATIVTATRATGGVNFKKFKKVSQFADENIMDIVYLVSSSQRNDYNHTSNVFSSQSAGVLVQDTDEFDPDLTIRTARRR